MNRPPENVFGGPFLIGKRTRNGKNLTYMAEITIRIVQVEQKKHKSSCIFFEEKGARVLTIPKEYAKI